MKALKTLVIMQLKEKLNLRNTKIDKKLFYKSIFWLIKFFLVVLLCYGLLFVCQYLSLFSLIRRIPTSVIAIVFSVMLVISVISSTLFLTQSMYYSNDNPTLLTLPCKPVQVYFSKLIVYFLFELKRNVSFIIPLLISFGLINGFTFIYYPWLFFCFFIISLLPVVIGAVLSIPTMFFYRIFKQYVPLQIISLLALIGAVTFVVVNLINIIPNNIDIVGTWGTTFWKVQDFLTEFTLDFNIFYRLTVMIVGTTRGLRHVLFTPSTFITLAILIVFILVVLGISLITARPLFYKMASRTYEYSKRAKKNHKNFVLPKNVSIYKIEFLLNVRAPERFFTNVILLIAMPVLIFFLNRIFAAMDTRMLGNNLAIAFNILIILLISLNSSYYASSVFSKDGRSSYLIKVQPSQYTPLLISKLTFNTLFMIVSFIITAFVLLANTSLDNSSVIALIIGLSGIYLAHLFYSAELDIMNPQLELYSTIGHNDNNPNEIKSTLVAFLGSFLTFGLMLFLLLEDSGTITYVKIMLAGIIIMLFRLYMLLNKIKLYYKERVV